jgi:uncharacterized protein (TIGR02145 family)
VNGVQGVSYSKYLLRSKLPVVTPGGGTFSAPTTIYVTSGNPDAKFYYTLDHTVPTSSSSVYDPKVGIVVKDPLTTVKVISQVEGFEPSNYVMNDYIVNQQDGVIGSFVDPRDNQSYPMTRITVNGVSQIWMARNLDYTPTTAGGYMCPENRADSCLKYGKLYNWQTAKKGGVAAAGGVRDICPDGWHLPTSVEWANLKTLARELRSTTSWDASNGIITTPTWSGNMNGTDKFGFTALPAGYFSTIFGGTGYQAYWWASDLTTSTTNVGYAMYARSYGYFDYLEIKDNAQYNFMSVRCLKDAN